MKLLPLLLLAWFAPLIRYKVWEWRWRRLPGHNPWKPGDSDGQQSL